MYDNLFLLAVGALGWGLSLATYRIFAARNQWPMGAMQSGTPIIPVVIGLVALVAGGGYALMRGGDYGGWAILIGGVVLALAWTGVLRVASQSSLFLAPVTAFLLVLGALAEPLGLAARPWATETLQETLMRKRGELEDNLRNRLLECERRTDAPLNLGKR